MIHRLLTPPEAREPAADALPATVKPWVWTVSGVAVTSLLAVTVSMTAGVTFLFAPVIVPSTALVAYGFWRVGRSITRRGHMVLYCLGGGAVAGVVNAILTLCLWSLFGEHYFLRHLNLGILGLAGLIGAPIGIAYGFAYLLPMLTQLSARSLRPTEGVDRCLVSYGIWGLLLLGFGASLALPFPHPNDVLHAAVYLIAGATLLLHASMVSLGTLRWARRRWWLGRVLKGKVPGWRVCDSTRFHPAQLEELQVFGSPLFARPLIGSPANQPRVLAWGDGTDAYRSTPLTPKYLVA